MSWSPTKTPNEEGETTDTDYALLEKCGVPYGEKKVVRLSSNLSERMEIRSRNIKDRVKSVELKWDILLEKSHHKSSRKRGIASV
ncbi:unknown [Feldmannia species virus]|uniref:Uncharacterized protein n=1 Tax=Feldmannia species virus TaxID=39420 RepID=B5LW95_9PHYC|nr:hypothetical protein FeldSpV_gp006 [Feldmannia species virus]ACH46758.1 unknown [Feldmannia species virus]